MDLPGIAIKNYHEKTSKSKLYVHDKFGPKVEMPISYFFRNQNVLSRIEKRAIKLCKGKVLDIGAGAGSHSLILQEKGLEVFAVDISNASCDIMKQRGLNHVICKDIYQFENEKFDTLLLLMNGIGLCGNLDGFRKFLQKAETLLNIDGFLLFDSSDIAYMYEGGEHSKENYYGTVNCRYEYQKQFTEWFTWLYIDFETLKIIAHEEGWKSELIIEDKNDQFLVKLLKI